MAGEEVADTRMVKPGAQKALQGRGNACQGIPQPVREPCGVGREVGVVTVEDYMTMVTLLHPPGREVTSGEEVLLQAAS